MCTYVYVCGCVCDFVCVWICLALSVCVCVCECVCVRRCACVCVRLRVYRYVRVMYVYVTVIIERVLDSQFSIFQMYILCYFISMVMCASEFVTWTDFVCVSNHFYKECLPMYVLIYFSFANFRLQFDCIPASSNLQVSRRFMKYQ